MFFFITVVVVGIAVGALAFYFTKRSNPLPKESLGIDRIDQEERQPSASNSIETPGVDLPQGLQDQTESEPESMSGDAQPMPSAPVSEPIPPAPIDQDRDGLPQAEEIGFGTSDNLADTDSDGLTDWDELKVYKSNPLVADTDGDTYIDGHEVQNGYSPTGPGRLNEIPQQQ